jgi:SAM-dependent methyltransferase
MNEPSIRPDLRRVVQLALDLPYKSESCQDAIPTDNHYQSITLGNTTTLGFRTARGEILDWIDFKGKTVLDLGCNLGELSRAARERGATLVDGFEYDPFFVELAQAVAAHNSTTRVSFYERDITAAKTYSDLHYDVVLAFSVFIYIKPLLHLIARATDLLIVETHELEDNLESYYLNNICPHFPYFAIIGESEWGTTQPNFKRRYVVAFAKREADLHSLLAAGNDRSALPPSWARVTRLPPPDSLAGSRLIDLDVPRTRLHKRFFSTFPFDSPSDIITALGEMEFSLDRLARSEDLRRYGADGWMYWALFVKGYTQFRTTGTVGPGNAYFDYLTNYYVQQGHNPGIVGELSDPSRGAERVRRRYADFARLQEQASGESTVDSVSPVRATVSDPPSEPPYYFYEVGGGPGIPVRAIDGWHRLLSASLADIRTLKCELVPENLSTRMLRGELEFACLQDDRIALEGWFLHPRERVFAYEVRVGRKTLGRGVPIRRQDIAAAFPQIEHAETSGFTIECTWPLAAHELGVIEVVALQDIFPVGSLQTVRLPGAQSSDEKSDLGVSEFRTAGVLHAIITRVARHVPLDRIVGVGSFSRDQWNLERSLKSFIPTASVVGRAPAALADDGFTSPSKAWMEDVELESIDLAIALSVAPYMRIAEQLEWIQDIGAFVRPGGFLALGVYGELVRDFMTDGKALDELTVAGVVEHRVQDFPGTEPATPLRTVQTREFTTGRFGAWFDVLDYVEGGVGNWEDLVLLRKRRVLA